MVGVRKARYFQFGNHERGHLAGHWLILEYDEKGGDVTAGEMPKMERILGMKDTRGRRNGGHINMNKE